MKALLAGFRIDFYNSKMNAIGKSGFFGLVEIDENIRILGKIITSETPYAGQPVRMKVGFENRPVYFFIVEKN